VQSVTYLESLFSLSGRVALVTGGSSGIGLAIAEALGRAGARVVVAARTLAPLERAVTQLGEAGARAELVRCDLSRRADVDRLCQASAEPFGDVDILVNCAGVNLRPPMGELTGSDWQQTMAVNLEAPYLLGQHFGPRMASRGWGRIINVASQQAERAFGNSGAYGVSKAAVSGLSRSQAEAWSRDGVCATTLVPGFVVTPMTQQTITEPGREHALAQRSMAGRNGVPSDFAGAAVFLASPASAYVTGTTLHVDGGFSVH
jgi:NAD(P)-dependent dehydrogenase (short-subunit alcohol dehydrogenase family)